MRIIRALSILLIATVILGGCRQMQLAEKAEGFNPQKQPLKKIVVLQPDFYRGRTYKSSLEHLHKNAYTLAQESTLIKSYKRAAERHQLEIVIPGVTDSMNSTYFNSITMLQKELMETGAIYDLENKHLSSEKFKKQLLTENLTLSPELQSLQKVYGTPYFYHSMLIQTDRLYLLSVLADVSAGKIVYRDLKEVNLKPKKANLDMLVFDSFYEMLILK